MTEESPEVRARMEAFMKQMDAILQECESVDEFLMLASSMMSYSKKMFETVLGEKGTRSLMIEMIPNSDEDYQKAD